MHRLFVFLLSMTWMAVSGMTEEKRNVEEAHVAYTTTIRGSEEPHRVLFLDKMDHFFASYESVWAASIDELLPDEDIAKIKMFLVENQKSQANDIAAFGQRTKELCAQIDAISAGALVAELEIRNKKFNSNQEDRYRALMKSLSSTGRAAIKDFVDTRIAPKITFSTTDAISLWNEFPDQMKEHFRSRCTRDSNEVQRLLNEHLPSQHPQEILSEAESTNATIDATSDDFGSAPE